MPLSVLVTVVICGIALVVLTVHLTGGSRVAHIESDKKAVDRFTKDYPEAEPVRCIISVNRRDAVVELADGHVGLVHAIGSHFLTRFVASDEISARLHQSRKCTVDLLIHDLTWPRAQMTFGDDETAQYVANLFSFEPIGQKRRRAA